jgi:hypothetical protein
VDSWRCPNTLGEGGNPNGLPFARLEVGAPPDQGSTGQGMEPTTKRRSLLDPLVRDVSPKGSTYLVTELKAITLNVVVPSCEGDIAQRLSSLTGSLVGSA